MDRGRWCNKQPTRRRGLRRCKRAARAGVALLAAGVVVVALLAVYFGRARGKVDATVPAAMAVPPGAARGMSVLLITLDTTRADRIACYGCQDIATPHLDALAAGGVRFAHVAAAAPITLASHATIMTGLDPPRHGVRDNGLFRLPNERHTLAEHLKTAGYATAGFVGAFVLDRRYGLAQGMDTFDDDLSRSGRVRAGDPQRPGDIVVDAALAWLTERDGQDPDTPFFAWVHLFDPHMPYNPPEPFASQYPADPYLGEIAFADAQVGRLVDWLRDCDRLNDTLLVVLADHGEGLGEHGEPTHMLLIYESTMAVPMIWHCPDVIRSRGVVTDRVVGIVDVTPTILDMLGIEAAADLDGLSLIRPAPAGRAVYMETLSPQLRHRWSPLHALRRVHDKFIAAPTPEYYDLQADPHELNNRYTQATGPARALEHALETRMARYQRQATGNAAIQPDVDAVRKLKALGYVSSSTAATPDAQRDPKVMIHRHADQQRAAELISTGGFAQAIALLSNVVQETPNDASAWANLGIALAHAGRRDDALPALKRAVALQPQERYWVFLARLHLLRDELAECERAVQALERFHPDDGEAAILRGELALRTNRPRKALEHFNKARDIDPSRQTARSYTMSAKAYATMDQPEKARQAYLDAIQSDPGDYQALEGLVELERAQGNLIAALKYARRLRNRRPLVMRHTTQLVELLMLLNQPEKAVKAMKRIVQLRPQDPAAHANMGRLLITQRDYAAAVKPLSRALNLKNKYPFASFNLGMALSRLGDHSAAINAFRKTLADKPSHRRARTALVRSLLAIGDSDEAAAELNIGIANGSLTRQRVLRDAELAALLQNDGG